MIDVIVVFGLIYSAVNWIFFAWLAAHASSVPKKSGGLEQVDLQGFDPEKVISAGGELAKAFKAAGVPATAAAMSLVGLIVAAVAAGIGKL